MNDELQCQLGPLELKFSVSMATMKANLSYSCNRTGNVQSKTV